MNDRDAINNTVFWLLLAFVTSWAGSEVIDAIQRERKAEEIRHFMNAGRRFTADDGAELSKDIYHLCMRVQHLETSHHNAGVEMCDEPKKFQHSDAHDKTVDREQP